MRRLSARVTDDAHRGWGKLCETHGVTFTAVIEASGRLLDERVLPLHDPNQVIELARKIDRERSERA